ncbi:MAG: FAD-binding oxidoreductase [Bacteroidetes bacterium]|nr:FAD-binding oxidoreductase [Bacteroidota bacterium]
MSKNILIIGAGLAGLTLAYRFKKKGHQVMLLDKGENHSSTVAAGMVNPMVFRRMNKSWRVEEFLEEAVLFYRELEDVLGVEFFHPISILRCFSSFQEKKWWIEKAEKKEYEKYLATIDEEQCGLKSLHCEFGIGLVKQAFWINAAVFIRAFQQYFMAKKEFTTSDFKCGLFDSVTMCYDDEKYDDVIFCVGHAQDELPYFQPTPIQKTKGQVLTIRSEELQTEYSLNRKCYVIPVGNNLYKVGATYEWHNATLNCTAAAQEEIKNKLSCLYQGDYQVIHQEVGIRPTTIDRRPVLGRSHENPHIYIFNGLGTKGYMMAPLLSDEMVDFILYNKEPPMEYNLNRFS